MEMLETESRDCLTAEDDQYRRLEARHREYEEQLEHIANRRPFTEKDWFEESVVKKKKLWVKDQMASLVRHHPTPDASASRR